MLSAHGHDFEQFAPHDAAGIQANGGFVHSSSVLAEGKLYVSSQHSRWPASEAYDERSYGVLQLDLYSDHFEWRFLPAAGSSCITLPVRSARCNPGPGARNALLRAPFT
jgi:hypothetical protein